MSEQEMVKRWTAKRKSALVMDIIKGSISISNASRQHDISPSELESWVDDARRGMENALRAKPKDIREQYEEKIKELTSAYGEAMLENKILKKYHALLNEEENSS